jgi:hypothetical protein
MIMAYITLDHKNWFSQECLFIIFCRDGMGAGEGEGVLTHTLRALLVNDAA